MFLNFRITPIALAMWGAAVLAVALGINTWRFRKRHGGIELLVLLISTIIWNVFNGLEYGSTEVETKELFSVLSYIGLVWAPTSSFLLSWNLFGPDRELHPVVKTFLFVIPVMTLALTATSRFHGLMWRDVSLHPVSGALDYDFGWVFYAWNIFANLVILAAVIVYARAFVRLQGVYRWQAAAMLAAMSPPWIASFIYLSGVGLGALSRVNLTSAMTGVSAVLIALNIRRFAFLRQSPVAWDQVLESMDEGLLVLDENREILDVNSALCEMFHLDPQHTKGKSVHDVMAPWKNTIQMIYRTPGLVLDAEFAGVGHLELRFSRLQRPGTLKPGWIVLVADITARKQIEQDLLSAHQALQAKAQELETAQHTLRTLGDIVPICAWCGKKIQQEDGTWVSVDKYIEGHSDQVLTHGICPACNEKYFGQG